MTKLTRVNYNDLKTGDLFIRESNNLARYICIKVEDGLFCLNNSSLRDSATPDILDNDAILEEDEEYYLIGDLSKVLFDLEIEILAKFGLTVKV